MTSDRRARLVVEPSRKNWNLQSCGEQMSIYCVNKRGAACAAGKVFIGPSADILLPWVGRKPIIESISFPNVFEAAPERPVGNVYGDARNQSLYWGDRGAAGPVNVNRPDEVLNATVGICAGKRGVGNAAPIRVIAALTAAASSVPV